MRTIYILHGNLPETNHVFMELFSTMKRLERFLEAHPEVIKQSITLHEVDPK